MQQIQAPGFFYGSPGNHDLLVTFLPELGLKRGANHITATGGKGLARGFFVPWCSQHDLELVGMACGANPRFHYLHKAKSARVL